MGAWAWDLRTQLRCMGKVRFEAAAYNQLTGTLNGTHLGDIRRAYLGLA